MVKTHFNGCDGAHIGDCHYVAEIGPKGLQGVDGTYIVSAAFNDTTYNIELTMSDGSVILAGPLDIQAGINGDPGPQGPQGERGPRGYTGAPGDPGRDGINGTNGSDGLPGEQGPQGERGEPGTRGMPGAKGDPGTDGVNGAPGTPGTPGEKGDKGDKGDPGEPGPQGIPGEPGATGPAGARGERGEYGPKGDTGRPGDPGEPGAPGEKGDPGDPGPQGIPGTKGDKGDKGDTGDPGQDGLPGLVQAITINGSAALVGGTPTVPDLQINIPAPTKKQVNINVPWGEPSIDGTILQLDYDNEISLRIFSEDPDPEPDNYTYFEVLNSGSEAKFIAYCEGYSTTIRNEYVEPGDVANATDYRLRGNIGLNVSVIDIWLLNGKRYTASAMRLCDEGQPIYYRIECNTL